MPEPRIMIVDDDADIRFTVTTILEESDLPATSASGGEEAIRKLREGFRGLIFMDVMMPGMDGWETLEAMVGEDLLKGQVVCMLTALEDPSPRQEHLKAHVHRYVKKPFDFDQLVGLAKHLLAGMGA